MKFIPVLVCLPSELEYYIFQFRAQTFEFTKYVGIRYISVRCYCRPPGQWGKHRIGESIICSDESCLRCSLGGDGNCRLVIRHQSAPACRPSSSSSSSEPASARTSAAVQRGPLTPINAVNGPTRSTSNCRIDSGRVPRDLTAYGSDRSTGRPVQMVDRSFRPQANSSGRFAPKQIRPSLRFRPRRHCTPSSVRAGPGRAGLGRAGPGRSNSGFIMYKMRANQFRKLTDIRRPIDACDI